MYNGAICPWTPTPQFWGVWWQKGGGGGGLSRRRGSRIGGAGDVHPGNDHIPS